MAGTSKDVPHIPYGFRESELFTAQAGQLIPDPRELDRALEGPTFTIARTPEVFAQVANTRLRRALFEWNARVLRIWFTFDPGRNPPIVLESIDIWPETEP